MEIMQRQYRGQRIDTKEWVYGCLLTGFFLRAGQDIPYIMTAEGTGYDSFEDITEGNGIYEVIPETIGQCTGLPDKNGKEIYEGNILRDSLAWVFAVEWDADCARFIGRHTKPRGDTYICYVDREPKAEIIGNIYEDGDLLVN
jgi:uncharacterized phage protein (TIGR01671 family)